MKIGLSYSRCILDIANGVVDIRDVLIIIARTDFNPIDDIEWAGIWSGYTHWLAEWHDVDIDQRDKFREITLALYTSGRMHQPRQFGTYQNRRTEIWLETVLPDNELALNPAAQKAWNNFQTIAGLTNVNLDKTYK